jgi:four helix bundle protein
VKKENIDLVKSKEFALSIIDLYKVLCKEKKEFVMSKQLVRSATSIGANIVEANYAISKKEFLAKKYISLKECAETQYWLELLYESNYIEKPVFEKTLITMQRFAENPYFNNQESKNPINRGKEMNTCYLLPTTCYLLLATYYLLLLISLLQKVRYDFAY